MCFSVCWLDFFFLQNRRELERERERKAFKRCLTFSRTSTGERVLIFFRFSLKNLKISLSLSHTNREGFKLKLALYLKIIFFSNLFHGYSFSLIDGGRGERERCS